MRQILQNSFYLLWLLILVAIPSESRRSERVSGNNVENPTGEKQRQGKLFSIFEIVKFPNAGCSTGTRNGTCYTSNECSSRGGTASETTCANGYGVCCIFSSTCGQTSNENCTYFENPAVISTDTDCNLEICPCGANICQIRLDFENFVITGPSTDSAARGRTRDGNFLRVARNTPDNQAAPLVSNAGQCLTDLFSVTSPGNSVPPPVCGTLTGEHMYVDLNEENGCDNLRFSFNSAGQGASIVSREWRIKITQYSCDYNNLAPPGCTQYFFGSNTGQIMTFNFNNQHLADQDQNICIRRESSNCRICYVPTGTTDFALSGPAAAAALNLSTERPDDTTACCNYGNDGLGTKGFDCVEIPGVDKRNAADDDNLNSRFCRRQGFETIETTVCTFLAPFSVRFRSDRYEFVTNAAAIDEGAAPDAGFRLAYVMDSTGCQL